MTKNKNKEKSISKLCMKYPVCKLCPRDKICQREIEKDENICVVNSYRDIANIKQN